jgi:hypothetical protein
VRPAAQVGEVALAVDADGPLALPDELVDDLVLEALVLAVQEFLRAVRLDVVARERKIRVDDLLHLRFDLRQVVCRDRPRQLEVVEEPVLDHRPDRVLHVPAVEVAQRLRQHVRGAVAHDVKAVGVAIGHERDLVLAVQLVVQVDELPVDLADDGRLR